MSLTSRIPRDTLIIPFLTRKEGFSLCYTHYFSSFVINIEVLTMEEYFFDQS
jgi:hypothetical protein